MELGEIDYSRKWYVMMAVAMGIFLGTVDGSIVNLALPTLVREFGTDFATVQWVVLAYLLALATLMVSVGRLADMIGKKPLYNAGFVIFTIGSLLCGLAPTVYWLVGFRVLQAIGASMVMGLGTAILTEAFPPSERGKALGIGGSAVSVGIIAGPTLGGLIIDALSWHWIFFVNLPVGLLGTLIVMRFVPAIKPAGGQRFDYGGALTLFVSLLSLLLALTAGQEIGFGDRLVLFLFASWLLFTAAFIFVEWRSDQPMVALRQFQNRLFSVNLTTGYLVFAAMAGMTLLMPFYLEDVLGYGPSQAGLLLAALPIVVGVMAPIAGSLSDRFGTRPITVAGLAALVVGFYAVSTLNAQTGAVGYVLRFLPVGIGIGVFQAPNNSAIMSTASRQRLGVVSSLLSTTRILGQTTGIAVLGALWASRVFYHTGVASPGGATAAPAAAQVAGLQDTFLGTVLVIALALALGIWGLLLERWGQKLPSDHRREMMMTEDFS
jgi:EmrB/QacA subfamily drug resistance transporter